jgi:hypothetical protein
MDELREEVEALLTAKYPGITFEWDNDPQLTRLSGYVIWSGFGPRMQVDRQSEMGAYLREHLKERASRLGLIFALTPKEREEPTAA